MDLSPSSTHPCNYKPTAEDSKHIHEFSQNIMTYVDALTNTLQQSTILQGIVLKFLQNDLSGYKAMNDLDRHKDQDVVYMSRYTQNNQIFVRVGHTTSLGRLNKYDDYPPALERIIRTSQENKQPDIRKVVLQRGTEEMKLLKALFDSLEEATPMPMVLNDFQSAFPAHNVENLVISLCCEEALARMLEMSIQNYPQFKLQNQKTKGFFCSERFMIIAYIWPRFLEKFATPSTNLPFAQHMFHEKDLNLIVKKYQELSQQSNQV